MLSVCACVCAHVCVSPIHREVALKGVLVHPCERAHENEMDARTLFNCYAKHVCIERPFKLI